MFCRDGVLLFLEPHPAGAGEDLVRHVGVAARAQRLAGERIDPRDGAWGQVPEPTCGAEHRVREELVVEPVPPAGERPSRAGRAVVPLGEAAFAMREPEELKVLVVADELREPGNDL